jgi:hypothetical protein
MRHRRLLHRKSALEIAHADLTATSHQDLENREADGMSQELEVAADAFQRLQIDLLSRTHGAAAAASAFRKIKNSPATAPYHVRMVTNALMSVNMSAERAVHATCPPPSSPIRPSNPSSHVRTRSGRAGRLPSAMARGGVSRCSGQTSRTTSSSRCCRRRSGFLQEREPNTPPGAEASLGGDWKPLSYSVSYAYIDVTYETHATLASVTEAQGVRIRPGDRIPGIPQHSLKIGAEYAVLSNVWIAPMSSRCPERTCVVTTGTTGVRQTAMPY